MMKSLNLGILAHVDAGKTSLTERILFEAGARMRLGSVDAGSTYTDDLALERERGITIRSAVASFESNGVLMNVLDTPGHPDFIAEVERTLAFLDVAIVVVSAVEGVQAQTRVLVRALRRMGIPHLFFVNKIDRRGADFHRTVGALRSHLESLPLVLCSVIDAGTCQARVDAKVSRESSLVAHWLDVLCEHDDALLRDYVLTPQLITLDRLHQVVRTQFFHHRVNPVLAGSAITGAGIDAVIKTLAQLAPVRDCSVDAPLKASVFKIDKGWGARKRFHLVMVTGIVHLRQTVETPSGPRRVTGIQVSAQGGWQPALQGRAGQVVCVTGLEGVRIGDIVGSCNGRIESARSFAPPAIETHVYPTSSSQTNALWEALVELSEQDPLIDLRRNASGQVFVSLYGEVQKEIIQARLSDEHGIETVFEESAALCIEIPSRTAEAQELLGASSNPFLATVGLRVIPLAPGSGRSFRSEVNSGLMPTSFYKAIEDSIMLALGEGRRGWPVHDCEVVLFKVDHESPSSTAADFRYLTPLVLAAALDQAGTVVFEPRCEFRIQAPAAQSGLVQALLAKAGATTCSLSVIGESVEIAGTVLATRVYKLQHDIPNVTRGLGSLESEVAAYAPVSGTPPERERSLINAFHRQDYLRQVKLGVNAGRTPQVDKAAAAFSETRGR